MRRSPRSDCLPQSVNLGRVALGDRPRLRLIEATRSCTRFRYRLPVELVWPQSTFVVSTENFTQHAFHDATVGEPAQLIFRPMVEKKPEFKTWVTDSCIHSLTPCFAESLYEIGDVRTRTPMIDIQKKPTFVVLGMLDRRQAFEYVLWRRPAIFSRNNVDLYSRDFEKLEVLLGRICIFASHDKEPIVAEGRRLSDQRSRRKSHAVSSFPFMRLSRLPRNGMAPNRPCK